MTCLGSRSFGQHPQTDFPMFPLETPPHSKHECYCVNLPTGTCIGIPLETLRAPLRTHYKLRFPQNKLAKGELSKREKRHEALKDSPPSTPPKKKKKMKPTPRPPTPHPPLATSPLAPSPPSRPAAARRGARSSPAPAPRRGPPGTKSPGPATAATGGGTGGTRLDRPSERRSERPTKRRSARRSERPEESRARGELGWSRRFVCVSFSSGLRVCGERIVG